jgi:hypothetical protein
VFYGSFRGHLLLQPAGTQPPQPDLPEHSIPAAESETKVETFLLESGTSTKLLFPIPTSDDPENLFSSLPFPAPNLNLKRKLPNPKYFNSSDVFIFCVIRISKTHKKMCTGKNH